MWRSAHNLDDWKRHVKMRNLFGYRGFENGGQLPGLESCTVGPHAVPGTIDL